MKRNLVLAFLLLATLGGGAYFFNPSNADHKMSSNIPDSISIQVGEAATSFVHRYPFVKIQKQPAGMNFYDIDPDAERPKRTIKVQIDHGKHSFEVPEVLSILGSEDLSYPLEGIDTFSLHAGVSPAEQVMHNDAKRYFFALLNKIKAAGWQADLSRSDPRLFSKDALHELLTNKEASEFNLSVGYEPTLAEWMQLRDRTSWQFYAEGVFLSVTFNRDSDHMDPSKPGAYLLSLTFSGAESTFRTNFKYEDRAKARELWPEVEKKLRNLRMQEEIKAEYRGLKIDKSYQDPPMPPAPLVR